MNKLSYLASLLLVATMLFSCSKEEPSLPLKLIQSETFSNGDHATYEYNSEGKLYKKTENVGSAMGVLNTHDITTTYTYSHDTIKVLIVSLGFDGTSQYTTTNNLIHVLNSQGYISKTIYLEKDTLNSLIYNYEYDLNGNLSKEIQKWGVLSNTANYKYSGDNMISTVEKSGTKVYTTNFLYFTNRSNMLNHENYGFNFYGKESKNLLRNASTVISDNTYSNTSYQYEFDPDGYVSKKTTKTDNYSEWVKYTYK